MLLFFFERPIIFFNIFSIIANVASQFSFYAMLTRAKCPFFSRWDCWTNCYNPTAQCTVVWFIYVYIHLRVAFLTFLHLYDDTLSLCACHCFHFISFHFEVGCFFMIWLFITAIRQNSNVFLTHSNPFNKLHRTVTSAFFMGTVYVNTVLCLSLNSNRD